MMSTTPPAAGVPTDSCAAVTSGADLPAAAPPGSQVGGIFSAYNPVDCHGIPLSAYTLDIDTGGLTEPATAVLSLVLSALWDFYRVAVALSVWMFDLGAGFGWLSWLEGPAATVAAGLQDLVTELGLIPLALVIAAVVGGIWVLRGRWAAGIGELMVSGLIAALAVGVLANPVTVITGEDGLLTRTQQLGVEVAAVVATGGRAGDMDAATLRAATSARLVEAFIRAPHQLINYGDVLEPSCLDVYDEGLLAGPDADGPPLRERIGQECGDQYQAYADDPSSIQVASAALILTFGGLLVVLMFLIAGLVLFATLVVLFESMKLVVGLVVAIVPGTGRGSLFHSLAEIAMALVVMLGTLLFASAFALLVASLLDPDSGVGNPVQTFTVLGLLTLVSIVTLLRWRQGAENAARRLAERLSTLSPGDNRIPEPSRLPAQGVAIATLAGRRLVSSGRRKLSRRT